MSDVPFRNVLLDTGPLVAVLNPRDSLHAAAVESLRLIEPPLLTCLPVITEAAWLLRSNSLALDKLFQGAQKGFFTLLPLNADDLVSINDLRLRYLDLGPQFADLALYFFALRDDLETIFTFDRRDFSVFRRRNKQPFRLLPADSADSDG